MNLDEEAGSAASGVHSTRRREGRVDELTHLLLSTADDDGNKSLCFEEFERSDRRRSQAPRADLEE